jgi:hypothetical protein
MFLPSLAALVKDEDDINRGSFGGKINDKNQGKNSNDKNQINLNDKNSDVKNNEKIQPSIRSKILSTTIYNPLLKHLFQHYHSPTQEFTEYPIRFDINYYNKYHQNFLHAKKLTHITQNGQTALTFHSYKSTEFTTLPKSYTPIDLTISTAYVPQNRIISSHFSNISITQLLLLLTSTAQSHTNNTLYKPLIQTTYQSIIETLSSKLLVSHNIFPSLVFNKLGNLGHCGYISGSPSRSTTTDTRNTLFQPHDHAGSPNGGYSKGFGDESGVDLGKRPTERRGGGAISVSGALIGSFGGLMGLYHNDKQGLNGVNQGNNQNNNLDNKNNPNLDNKNIQNKMNHEENNYYKNYTNYRVTNSVDLTTDQTTTPIISQLHIYLSTHYGRYYPQYHIYPMNSRVSQRRLFHLRTPNNTQNETITFSQFHLSILQNFLNFPRPTISIISLLPKHLHTILMVNWFHIIISTTYINDYVYKYHIDRTISPLVSMWRLNLISNFDYLLHHNLLANRSFNDVTQQPIMPQVSTNISQQMKTTQELLHIKHCANELKRAQNNPPPHGFTPFQRNKQQQYGNYGNNGNVFNSGLSSHNNYKTNQNLMQNSTQNLIQNLPQNTNIRNRNRSYSGVLDSGTMSTLLNHNINPNNSPNNNQNDQNVGQNNNNNNSPNFPQNSPNLPHQLSTGNLTPRADLSSRDVISIPSSSSNLGPNRGQNYHFSSQTPSNHPHYHPQTPQTPQYTPIHSTISNNGYMYASSSHRGSNFNDSGPKYPPYLSFTNLAKHPKEDTPGQIIYRNMVANMVTMTGGMKNREELIEKVQLLMENPIPTQTYILNNLNNRNNIGFYGQYGDIMRFNKFQANPFGNLASIMMKFGGNLDPNLNQNNNQNDQNATPISDSLKSLHGLHTLNSSTSSFLSQLHTSLLTLENSTPSFPHPKPLPSDEINPRETDNIIQSGQKSQSGSTGYGLYDRHSPGLFYSAGFPYEIPYIAITPQTIPNTSFQTTPQLIHAMFGMTAATVGSEEFGSGYRNGFELTQSMKLFKLYFAQQHPFAVGLFRLLNSFIFQPLSPTSILRDVLVLVENDFNVFINLPQVQKIFFSNNYSNNSFLNQNFGNFGINFSKQNLFSNNENNDNNMIANKVLSNIISRYDDDEMVYRFGDELDDNNNENFDQNDAKEKIEKIENFLEFLDDSKNNENNNDNEKNEIIANVLNIESDTINTTPTDSTLVLGGIFVQDDYLITNISPNLPKVSPQNNDQNN